jgi:putative ABC transport system ATP-binding protein
VIDPTSRPVPFAPGLLHRLNGRVGSEGRSSITSASVPDANTVTPLVELAGIEKVFHTGRLEYAALRGIDLSLDGGEFVSIVGPSGSGKSTILNIVSGIDRPTAGTVTVSGRRIDQMGEEELAVWRGETIGIVFQFFQLLPTLTALENAMLPLDFASGISTDDRRARANHNLELVGLSEKADHMPMELSGGEQQRVAIARALARDPTVLVADEPTGNLDSTSAGRILDLLDDLHLQGTTILLVTHDPQLAARAERIVAVRDGLVIG